MKDDRELKLECVKVAVGLSSPSVNDRAGDVVQIATTLYNYLNATPTSDKRGEVELPKPRGRRDA